VVMVPSWAEGAAGRWRYGESRPCSRIRRSTRLRATRIPSLDPQAPPDLAMTLARKRGAFQIGANGGQERLVRDRGLGATSAWRRWGLPLLLPVVIETGTGHVPGGAYPLHAVGSAGGLRDRGAHRFDLRWAKGALAWHLARNNSFSMVNSPTRLEGGVQLGRALGVLAGRERRVDAHQRRLTPGLQAEDGHAQLAGHRIDRLAAQQPQGHGLLAASAPPLPGTQWPVGGSGGSSGRPTGSLRFPRSRALLLLHWLPHLADLLGHGFLHSYVSKEMGSTS
jgi:hypothetical protein